MSLLGDVVSVVTGSLIGLGAPVQYVPIAGVTDRCDAALPADPEFRAAIVCYLEWGTRLAMGNSQPGAEVRRARHI